MDLMDLNNDEKLSDTEKVKKTLNEIKIVNDNYNKKLKLLNEKKQELNQLQVETFEALQKATVLNEQFNSMVNNQLLKERDKLQLELDKLKKT